MLVPLLLNLPYSIISYGGALMPSALNLPYCIVGNKERYWGTKSPL